MATEAQPAKDSVKHSVTNENGIEVDIIGPLTFWLSLLIIGVILDLVVVPLAGTYFAPAKGILVDLANWILYLPGAIILPLIVSIWVGERVGGARSKVKPAVAIGIINAAYICLIYIVAIFIIYLLVHSIAPMSLAQSNITTAEFLEYVVALPVIIVLALIPVVSALSAARHSGY